MDDVYPHDSDVDRCDGRIGGSKTYRVHNEDKHQQVNPGLIPTPTSFSNSYRSERYQRRVSSHKYRPDNQNINTSFQANLFFHTACMEPL